MKTKVRNNTDTDIEVGAYTVPALGTENIDKSYLDAYKRSMIVKRHYDSGNLEDIE